jgi:DNA polymerase-3 subunit alpha
VGADGVTRPVIRYALAAVKNVGEGSIQAILEARRSGGRFSDLMDFLERVDPRALNRRVVESLIKAGAFDDVQGRPTRAAMLEGLEKAMEEAGRRRRDASSGQVSLFGGGAASKLRVPWRLPDVPERPLAQKLALEREVLGLFLSGHPMEAHAADVDRLASCDVAGLSAWESEAEVRIIAVPGEVKVVKTRRGDRMAFVTLEDASGSLECVFFSEPWMRSQAALKDGKPVLVTGRVERSADAVKLLATTAEPLEEVRARTFREVRLRVRADELGGDRVERLLALLVAERGDCELRVELHHPGRYRATLAVPEHRVAPTQALEDGLLALFGRPDTVVMS